MTARLIKAEVPEFLVFVEHERQTDGSYVYNVVFGGVTIAAIDADNAAELANAIADAINDCSVNTAGVVGA